MSKLDKLEQQLDSGTCPNCEKQRLNLDEEGAQHASSICANCHAEVVIEYDLVPRSVTMFLPPENPRVYDEPMEITLYEASE